MLDFNTILTATHAAVVNGATDDAAAKAGFAVVLKAKAKVADLLAQERACSVVKRGVHAAYQSLVGGLRALLVQESIDVADAGAVRDAIRAHVWLDEGYAVALVNSKAAPLAPAALKAYQNVSARISRLARDIVGVKPMAETVTVRVGKALQTEIDALYARIATLKSEHGANVVREALKRAAKGAK